jgi:hypothetical protein
VATVAAAAATAAMPCRRPTAALSDQQQRMFPSTPVKQADVTQPTSGHCAASEVQSEERRRRKLPSWLIENCCCLMLRMRAEQQAQSMIERESAMQRERCLTNGVGGRAGAACSQQGTDVIVPLPDWPVQSWFICCLYSRAVLQGCAWAECEGQQRRLKLRAAEPTRHSQEAEMD